MRTSFVIQMYNWMVRISSRVGAVEWIAVNEAFGRCNISKRQVQALCENGKVSGAERLGNMRVIPKGAEKPIDGRTKAAKQANCGGG
jgi:hypothetical protein